MYLEKLIDLNKFFGFSRVTFCIELLKLEFKMCSGYVILRLLAAASQAIDLEQNINSIKFILQGEYDFLHIKNIFVSIFNLDSIIRLSIIQLINL